MTSERTPQEILRGSSELYQRTVEELLPDGATKRSILTQLRTLEGQVNKELRKEPRPE